MAFRDLIPSRRMRNEVADPMRDPFFSFRSQMDRLFDDFFSDVGPGRFLAPTTRSFFSGANWPSIEVNETENEYRVTAEISGMEEKDVNLSLKENVLTISGEKRGDTQQDDKTRRVSEHFYGRFERVIPFDVEIDADKVAAKFKSGLLTVILPKNPKAQDTGRRIQISSSQ
ncbi:MAG: Hsp20 family protein [Alphaproteobacteria bacterium]|nr:Hsp20 family protein [Alphaproteobacteria bacterium]